MCKDVRNAYDKKNRGQTKYSCTSRYVLEIISNIPIL